MRVLVDTNVFLDVLLDRPGLADESQSVLDWCESSSGDAWIAWHTLSNLYYIGAKLVGVNAALGEIDRLLDVFEICPCRTRTARTARNLAMQDFEDALQAAAALEADVEVIVTRNVADFNASPVPALLPSAFLNSLVPSDDHPAN
jgi:predicted nucleic acid-binding protein